MFRTNLVLNIGLVFRIALVFSLVFRTNLVLNIGLVFRIDGVFEIDL